MQWGDLEETVRLGVRFLDNVLDVNHYPIQEIEDNCKQVRRIGLGVMGLHSMLLDMGMKYNSEEAFAFVDKLMAFIKNTAYDASIMLAVEKGAFPAYDPRFADSGFMKTMKPAIRRKVKEYGIRNCALLTIAPTGTTSMVQGVTGGIEPLFSPVYIRRRKTIDGNARNVMKRTLVVSQEYLDHADLVQGAYDVSPRDHLEMQKIVQKHLDNAVSKTANLPEDFPVEDLADLWLEYLPYMKGSTFYRQGSRGEEPMEHVPADEMKKIIANWTEEIEYEQAESMECPSGVCEVPNILQKEVKIPEGKNDNTE
jgi:ribonucleoside-diphosphate reductase alpha chain